MLQAKWPHEQGTATAFMTGGPTAAMLDPLRSETDLDHLCYTDRDGNRQEATHEQESANAFMTGGPTAAMPDTLRLRRDPLSVSAASPTLVTLVQRLRDTSCRYITQSKARYTLALWRLPKFQSACLLALVATPVAASCPKESINAQGKACKANVRTGLAPAGACKTRPGRAVRRP